MAALRRIHLVVLYGSLVAVVSYLPDTHLRAADKAPVPSSSAQDKALKLVKDVYGDEYAKAESSEQKTALAKKLLQSAKETDQGTANHYALLRVAWDAATQAGDAKLAMQVTQEMVDAYEVNALTAKVATVKTIAASVRSSEQRAALATVALDAGDEAVAGDNYEVVVELVQIALSAARKAQDWQLVKQIVARDKAFKKMAEVYAKAQEALVALEEDPTDPEANQAAGEYFCFVKGDWAKGIPMLALGSDDTLKALAQKDLKGADAPDEQVEIGDGWWELAQTEQGDQREAMLLRASGWYGEAKAKLSSGLILTKVTRRLEDIAKIGRPAPKPPAARNARPPLPDGAVLVMTFEPNTFAARAGKMYVSDLSGAANHGIVQGGPTPSEGIAGAGLKFDGRDDHISLPSLRGRLIQQPESVTLSMWVKEGDLKEYGFVVDVGSQQGVRCIALMWHGKRAYYRFDLPKNSGCISEKVEPGQWRHVVAAWDGSQQCIYVNGKLHRAKPVSGFTLSETSVSTETARIGGQAMRDFQRNRYFNGFIDEVAVFSRALSEEEIQTLHQMGLQGNTLVKSGKTRSSR